MNTEASTQAVTPPDNGNFLGELQTTSQSFGVTLLSQIWDRWQLIVPSVPKTAWGVQKGESSAPAFGDSVEVFSCPSRCLLRQILPIEVRSSGYLNCQRQEESCPLSHFPCFFWEWQRHSSSHSSPTDNKWEIPGKQLLPAVQTAGPGSFWSQWEVNCSFSLFSAAAEMEKGIVSGREALRHRMPS